MRLFKKRREPLEDFLWRESTEQPAEDEAEEKLPPRAPNIICSQAPLFVFLRILLGAFLGFLLSLARQAFIMFQQGGFA